MPLTEANAIAFLFYSSATSARYATAERALVVDVEPDGFCFLGLAGCF
ncbi:MAG TPA: hypothetical protein VGH42_08105 [Verrucomicrobiae bacterium]